MKKILILTYLLAESLHAQWVQTNGIAGQVHALAVDGTYLYAGTDAGVFLSTNNGTSWTAVNSGLADTVVLSLTVSGTNLFAGTQGYGSVGGIFRSTNNGTSWSGVNSGFTTDKFVNALVFSGTSLFAGDAGSMIGGVFRSTNNGDSWTKVNSGLADSTGRPDTLIHSLGILDTNIFAGTNFGHIYRSTNNGSNWTEVYGNSIISSSFVYAFAVSGTNLFAGIGSGVFLSSNNGTTWNVVNAILPGNVFTLAVSGMSLFAGTSIGGVLLSTDNGISWRAVNMGLTNTTVNALAVSGSNLIAGTGAGVFRADLNSLIPPAAPQNLVITDTTSSTIGIKWSKNTEADFLRYRIYRGTMPNPTIKVDSTTGGIADTSKLFTNLSNGTRYYLRVTAVDSALNESAYSNEVNGTPTVTVGVDDILIQRPKVYALSQNYPNPFNPSTTLSYGLPLRSRVRLVVYNVLGQVIADLVNTEQNAGWNHIVWNAKVASGLYFYRLDAVSVNDPNKRFVDVKKMILLK